MAVHNRMDRHFTGLRCSSIMQPSSNLVAPSKSDFRQPVNRHPESLLVVASRGTTHLLGNVARQ
jgi:hypothetical protein